MIKCCYELLIVSLSDEAEHLEVFNRAHQLHVCLYVYFRGPHHRGYGAEIWHQAGVLPRKVLANLWTGHPLQPWAGEAKEWF